MDRAELFDVCLLQLRFFGFPYTITFLSNPVVVAAVPKRIHDWVQSMPVTCGAVNFGGVLVRVVAVTVAAVFAFVRHLWFLHEFFPEDIRVTFVAAKPFNS